MYFACSTNTSASPASVVYIVSPRPDELSGVRSWLAQISIKGRVTKLGYYGDEDEAARAYDVEARKRGREVNFAVGEGEADDGGTGSGSKAAGPSSKRSRAKGQRKGRCSVCGQPGHNKRTCKKK